LSLIKPSLFGRKIQSQALGILVRNILFNQSTPVSRIFEECDGIYAKACSEVYHLICVQKHVLKLSTLFYILGEIINTKMEKHIRLCCTLLLPQLGIATRDLIFGMLWFGLSLHKDTHLQVSINGKQVAYSFVGVASNFISWC
jgi:hypothetical protein